MYSYSCYTFRCWANRATFLNRLGRTFLEAHSMCTLNAWFSLDWSNSRFHRMFRWISLNIQYVIISCREISLVRSVWLLLFVFLSPDIINIIVDVVVVLRTAVQPVSNVDHHTQTLPESTNCQFYKFCFQCTSIVYEITVLFPIYTGKWKDNCSGFWVFSLVLHLCIHIILSFYMTTWKMNNKIQENSRNDGGDNSV